MQNSNQNLESGQTLVETMVGLVVLVIGIVTALSLATSVFTQTTQASKKVVAMGLAREGAEAVFNMRATNWLRNGLVKCHHFGSASDEGSVCREDWLTSPFDIQGSIGSGTAYVLSYPSNSGKPFWDLTPVSDSYELYLAPTLDGQFLYTTNKFEGEFSGFYRQIVISQDATTSPYDENVGPRLKVQSRVWWSGRGCVDSPTWPTSGSCRIELATFLTNWRNY